MATKWDVIDALTAFERLARERLSEPQLNFRECSDEALIELGLTQGHVARIRKALKLADDSGGSSFERLAAKAHLDSAIEDFRKLHPTDAELRRRIKRAEEEAEWLRSTQTQEAQVQAEEVFANAASADPVQSEEPDSAGTEQVTSESTAPDSFETSSAPPSPSEHPSIPGLGVNAPTRPTFLDRALIALGPIRERGLPPHIANAISELRFTALPAVGLVLLLAVIIPRSAVGGHRAEGSLASTGKSAYANLGNRPWGVSFRTDDDRNKREAFDYREHYRTLLEAEGRIKDILTTQMAPLMHGDVYRITDYQLLQLLRVYSSYSEPLGINRKFGLIFWELSREGERLSASELMESWEDMSDETNRVAGVDEPAWALDIHNDKLDPWGKEGSTRTYIELSKRMNKPADSEDVIQEKHRFSNWHLDVEMRLINMITVQFLKPFDSRRYLGGKWTRVFLTREEAAQVYRLTQPRVWGDAEPYGVNPNNVGIFWRLSYHGEHVPYNELPRLLRLEASN